MAHALGSTPHRYCRAKAICRLHNVSKVYSHGIGAGGATELGSVVCISCHPMTIWSIVEGSLEAREWDLGIRGHRGGELLVMSFEGPPALDFLPV